MPYKNKEDKDRWWKRYYSQNKDILRKKARIYRDKGRDLINQTKSVPCADCGHEYPYYVMDFDHRPGTEKSFHLLKKNPGLRGMDRLATMGNKLKQEIAKCDIVCANCHRIRTFNRKKSGDFI